MTTATRRRHPFYVAAETDPHGVAVHVVNPTPLPECTGLVWGRAYLSTNGVQGDRVYVVTPQGLATYPATWVRLGSFACEGHEAPGACDVECLALAEQMDPPHTCVEDPTGCSYVPADYAEPTTRLVLQDATVVRVRA